MGFSNSPAALQRKLGIFGEMLTNTNGVQVRVAAELTQRLTLSHIHAATRHADLRLTGIPKGKGKLNVRVIPVKTGADAESLVKATGPLHLLERDTKAGMRPRKRRSGRGKNRMVGPILAYYHPGTKGKHPFEKGVVEAAPLVKELFESNTVTIMRSIF